MKTIMITTFGPIDTGKRNLLRAFEHLDFQNIAHLSFGEFFMNDVHRELLIDGEKIDVGMIHISGNVCLIYIKIDLHCI